MLSGCSRLSSHGNAMELIMAFPALTALQLGVVSSLVGLLATALAAIRIGKRPEGLPPGRSQVSMLQDGIHVLTMTALKDHQRPH